MQEDRKQKYSRVPHSPEEILRRRNDRLETGSETKSNASGFPELSDEVVDQILAEQREKENCAHE